MTTERGATPAVARRAATPQDFAGRVAIVTGAWRGLGRAAVSRLYERGASVAVNVRDAARADSVCQSLGDRALAVPGDIAAAGVPRRTKALPAVVSSRFSAASTIEWSTNAAMARSTRLRAAVARRNGERSPRWIPMTVPFLFTKAVLPTYEAPEIRFGSSTSIDRGAHGQHPRRRDHRLQDGTFGLTRKYFAKELRPHLRSPGMPSVPG